MKLRKRPKSDYLQEADLESLYVLTEHWQSDCDFYKDELRFLKSLIGKYFIWLINDDNIKHVNQLSERLKQMSKLNEKLSHQIKEHLKHIQHFINQTAQIKESAFRKEHEALEDDLADFMKDHQKLKKEVFEATEKAIDEDKIQHFLNQ